MSESVELVQCTRCKEMVTEVCGGEHCRDCHVSIGWEECLDGSWNDRQRRAAGFPTNDERSEG